MNLESSFSKLFPSASEKEIKELKQQTGGIPEAYREFLNRSNGADGALGQPDSVALRIYPTTEQKKLNEVYEIQKWMPNLWMFGDDSGDYAYCFNREENQASDLWQIVEIPLGDLSPEEVREVENNFSTWAKNRFQVNIK
ncbi:SMI1/KNR4 family protein [Coraliomargarita algicola]|uniref:SMI1/KNR4 family protein n=1 Tax=Coraliomargarita algicola TaxID=3092156 RepID=A0ABZ0RHR1_9BACT|nr:SMI1/KNR4 family protein [Coraliomargarita sp. J2-16]WPJ94555.1 SMI1/KNR4 family protein [Coraliomargarita sp. J2-16]